ncbi:MAG: S9 family peptidase [Chlorobiaceae bacterium]|nr:S9 family peptidase [Chlorobiaceae bacterium]MBA4309918.1 S9 family peptidase [Chlorobiaceae bacterium]
MKTFSRNLFFFLFIAITVSFAQKKDFTVEAIQTNRAFAGKNINGVQWYDNGNKYSFLKMDTVIKSLALYTHDLKTGEETRLLSTNDLREASEDTSFSIQNYQWSPHSRYILFTGVTAARGVKSSGKFYVYNFLEKKFKLVVESEKTQLNAQFSPDGEKLGFVRGDNLFVVDIQTGKETQLTFDGNGIILNGHFDWVYEEEFSIINAFQWSPESNKIAYWRLDQSQVPEIQIAKWDSLYFNFIEMRYPKAGAKNSLVQIGIVDIYTTKTAWVDLGEETDIYVPRINFADNQTVAVQRLNRLQNTLDFLFADANTGKTHLVFQETNPAWIDVHDNLRFLKSKKQFIWTSEKNGFNHIYLYDFNGKTIKQLTNGNWEVNDVLSVDEKNNLVYFTANERGTKHQDLFSVKLDGSKFSRITEAVGFHAINLSPNYQHFISRYSNANTLPSSFLYDVTGVKIRDLALSDMKVFKEYKFSPLEFLNFTTSDGVVLNASMIKPTDFDPNKKYPVLVFNYSGPGSQLIFDRWGGGNFLWHQLLAQKGYIIFMIDNRGTGGRGKEFKNLMYKDLGKWEVFDHIEAAKYLASLGYVDSERIGIWGWSYGGYVSALTLLKAADYYKVAISVAPVTDWSFYDTIYTERYMQTPELNPEGYERSSVLKYTENLKGKLLLVHGTADDNVHLQNAVKLAEKLIAEAKPFEMMFYPERDHGIFGGKSRLHLYNMMTEFILNNL